MSEDLAFGYTTFDDLYESSVSIFQCITEEGWVDVMYQIMDAYNPVVGAFYFCLLILFGPFARPRRPLLCFRRWSQGMMRLFLALLDELATRERGTLACGMRACRRQARSSASTSRWP